jgi:uncharacterized surface protein with fasciclin (FAS1) repeats/uncharacterized protein YegP (UPF0339 family)
MADIFDIAVEAGGFTTLVAAVQAAGLVEILKGKGPFTIFAPNDDAFAKLPAGTVDELLKNKPKLKAILMYHIVYGKFTVDEIGQVKIMKTAQGQDIKIDAAHWWTSHWNPLINDAHIVNTDVVTDNGIIQVLNGVLMPNMDLTCPVCGMGFMTKEDMNAHTKMGHEAKKVPAPMPLVEVPQPEPLPPTEVIKQPIPATGGVFEVISDSAGAFRFHLKAANAQIIAVSHSFGTKEAALKGIALIKKNAPIAKTVDFSPGGAAFPHTPGVVKDAVFEIQFNAPDRFRFHLKTANGQIIAISQSYLSKGAAENGIASVKTNAPQAKIIDQTIAVT